MNINTVNLKKIAILQIVALLLIASWIIPKTKTLWMVLDQTLFLSLNSAIGWGKEWAFFFAVANHKATDLLTCILLVLITVSAILINKKSKRSLLCKIVSLISYHIFGILLFKFLVWELIFDSWFQRSSPGIVFSGKIFNLIELVPNIKLRPFSHHCFPSDHGLFFGSFILAFFIISKSLLVRAFLISIIISTMCLPRMIYGGHWFTDIFFAVLITNFFISPYYYLTPIKTFSYKFFSKIFSKLVKNFRVSF